MARGFLFDELTRHILILGKPGQGKTNLLLSLILQLGDPAVQEKHPSAQIFIDPHGDASFKLARTMKDWSKLLLLDPTEIQLSMNPLELLPYETDDERIFQIQMTVSELLMILEDILKTDLDRASRMSWIFTGGLYFLYHFTGSPTFVDLYDLMIDFQTLPTDEVETMLKNANVPDEILEKTMEAIARLENAAYSPVLNRIAKFIIPTGSYAARTFCCRKSNAPWELMLEPGRTTIISVSKSDLPNEFRELLTNSLVMKFHFLIQQRARKLKREHRFGEESRTPVFLFVDEFQTIERLAILETILSEARKFGLSLVLAHQNIAQLKRPELRESLLANVGLLCALTVGPDDAALLSKIFGAEFRERLLELEQGKMVLRRQPPGEVAWTEVMQTDRIPDPVHEPEEVVRFMQTEMKIACPPVPEDRDPIYRRALKEMREEEGLPWVGVIKSCIAWHLHYFTSHSLNTYSYMVKEFGARQGWDSTRIHNAINWLEVRGYITERVILGKAYRGKDPAGNVIWAEPETQDELERARTFMFYLTAKGEEAFFGRPPIKTNRAGGPLHLRIMDYYLNAFSRKRGFFPVADYGENHGKFPDIIVYPPVIKHDEKRNREVWEPEEWNKKDRIAIEVETNPSKHAKQLVKNYEKDVGKYARLIFAVVDEKHREDIKRILADRDPSTYEIDRPVLGLSVEELQREKKEEENIADEAPVAGSEDSAAGSGTVEAVPTSAATSRQQGDFIEDDTKSRPTRGFFSLPQLMQWHKEEFGEHQLFTGSCPCGLADAETAGSPTTLIPVDQLLPWAVRYCNRDRRLMAGQPVKGMPPAKPAEKEQQPQQGEQERKEPDVIKREAPEQLIENKPVGQPAEHSSVTEESAAKQESSQGVSSGQPTKPLAEDKADGDLLSNEETSNTASGDLHRGLTGGGRRKNSPARFHQLMILRLIEARGPRMRSELVKELDARPRSVTRYVHDLITGGFVTEDAKRYYLTEKGKEVLRKLHQELGIRE